MNQHQTDKRIRLPRRAWFIALVAIFAFAVASLPQLGSIVRAQEPDSNSGSQANTVPPPPGDCWGGALSEDPLHCYALEKAQRDGVIEVEGVYNAWGQLNIFFNYRTGSPVSTVFDQGRFEDLLETLKDNARDFIARFPERVTYNLPYLHANQATPRKPTGIVSCDSHSTLSYCLGTVLIHSFGSFQAESRSVEIFPGGPRGIRYGPRPNQMPLEH